jgi:hypothetical protein
MMNNSPLAGLFGLANSDDWRKSQVWANWPSTPGTEMKRDCDGRWMRKEDHGDRNSQYGWEMDHIRPVALGGSDDLINMRPRHCSGNARAGGLLGGLLNLK